MRCRNRYCKSAVNLIGDSLDNSELAGVRTSHVAKYGETLVSELARLALKLLSTAHNGTI